MVIEQERALQVVSRSMYFKNKRIKDNPVVVVVVPALVTSPPLMSALISCSSFYVIAT